MDFLSFRAPIVVTVVVVIAAAAAAAADDDDDDGPTAYSLPRRRALNLADQIISASIGRDRRDTREPGGMGALLPS